jgi:hypothetical protein
MLPGFNHPVIRGFYANSFIKAFVLNAIAVAMVAASSVELRQLLNEEKSGAYLFFNDFLNGGKLSEVQKAVIVFIGSFVFAMFTYLFLFFFFGFGGGMLTSAHNTSSKLTKNGFAKVLVGAHG